MINFSFKVDLSNVQGNVDKALKRAQAVLDEQVMKDSNFYAPEDIGTLQGSTQRASAVGEGRVSWDTPYARRLYYNPQYNFSKDKNKNAGGLWFERAKMYHGKDWIRITQAEIDKNI